MSKSTRLAGHGETKLRRQPGEPVSMKGGRFECIRRRTGATSFTVTALMPETVMSADPTGRTPPAVLLMANFCNGDGRKAVGGMLDFATARALGEALVNLADAGEAAPRKKERVA